MSDATPQTALAAVTRRRFILTAWPWRATAHLLTWQGEGHTAYPQTRCINTAVNRYLVDQGLAGVDLGGVPLVTALIGVGGSVLLALLAATWPALRAARLPAREAVGVL